MKKGISVLIILISLSLLGCSTVGKPVIKGVENRWGEITNNYTEILTEIEVYNPNPFSIPIKDVLTEVYLNSMKVGEGKSLQSEIKPKTKSTILISTKIDNEKIPKWWISHIKNGEKSMLGVKGYLIFDLRVTTFKFEISEMKRKIETNFLGFFSEKQSFDLGIYRVTVESVRTEWGDVDYNVTQIIAEFKIKNENIVPLYLKRMHYIITVNDIVLGEGYTDVNEIVQPKSSAEIPVILNIQTQKIKDWWISHIRNGEKSEVSIKIRQYVEIDKKKFEFEMDEMKFNFETHILE